MNPPEPNKQKLLGDWLAKAETDFEVAVYLVGEGPIFPSAIAFHCQQAAEKYIKAYLVWHEVDFPKTHDLEQLLDLMESVGADLAESLRDVIVLTPYGTELRYSTRGELLRTWDETTYPVQYGYDDFGRRTSITTYRTEQGWTGPTWPSNPTGDATLFIYGTAQNPSRFLTRKEYADDNGTDYTYTPDGRVATRTWAREHNSQPLVTTYDYYDDANEPLTGEPQSVTYSDSTPTLVYTYNRLGQQETITDAVGMRTFTYRDDGQLDTEDIVAGQSGLYSKLITRTYQSTTPIGRATGFQIGDANDPDADYTVGYGYDAYGRMYGIQGPGVAPGGVTYDYEGNSDLVQTIAFRDSSLNMKASANFEYAEHRDLIEFVENIRDPNGTPATLSKYAYAHDNVSRRESVVNTGAAFSASAFSLWHNNDRSELTGSWRGEGTTVQDPPTTEVTAERRLYTYDPIGNRLTSSEAGGSSKHYCANAVNQYEATGAAVGCPTSTESFAYDADGNLTNDGTHLYTWDAENRLRSIEPAAAPIDGEKKLVMEYDYMSRRVRKRCLVWDETLNNNEGDWSETPYKDLRFVYDQWNIVLVLDGLNSSSIRTKFTWGLDLSGQRGNPSAAGVHGAGGIGGLLAVQEMTGTHQGSYWYLYDANGNVGQIVKNTTNYPLAAHYEYDAYGKVLLKAGDYAERNSFRFSTKWVDNAKLNYTYGTPRSSLGHWGYRYYSSQTGRWLSRDPLEIDAGNTYAFVHNNAIDYLDPDGRYIIALGGAGGLGDTGFFGTVSDLFDLEQQWYDENLPCRVPGIQSYTTAPTGALGVLFPDWSGAVSGLTGAIDSYMQYYRSVMERRKAGECVCPELLHIVGFSDGASTIALWMKLAQLDGVPDAYGLIGLVDLVRKGTPIDPDYGNLPNLSSSNTYSVPRVRGVDWVSVRNQSPLLGLTPGWVGYDIRSGWSDSLNSDGTGHLDFPRHRLVKASLQDGLLRVRSKIT